MNTPISKTRSKKSRQRDREEIKKLRKPHFWTMKNAFMGVVFWIAAITILLLGGNLQYSLLLPGQQAPATVVNSTDFSCIDITGTAIEQQNAAARVPPIFRIDTSYIDSGRRSLDKFFLTLQTVVSSNSSDKADNQIQKAVGDMLEMLNIPLPAAEQLTTIPPDQLAIIHKSANAAFNQLATNAITSMEQKEKQLRSLAAAGMISIESSNSTQTVALDDLPEASKAIAHVVQKLSVKYSLSKPYHRTLISLLHPWVKPNLVYDPIATERIRNLARQQVVPEILTVKAGTTLVAVGERITPAIQEKLKAYDRRLRALITPRDRILNGIGDGTILLIALLICGGILRINDPKTLSNDSSLVIMLLLFVLSILPLKGLLYLSNSMDWLSQSILMYAFPVALTTLLATVLLTPTAALAAGFWTTIVAAMLLGQSFNVLVLGMLVTVTTIRASHGIHRRSRIFRAGFIAGLVQILFAIAMFILNQPDWSVLLQQALTGLINGLICAFLTLLLIPLFELLFGITTDTTLLELCDMGNPLLQRLAIEAPGTYHHSLMVANLAAAAAQEVGANALAVRVSAYFHDIGKLTKPEFFIENSHHRANPHDDLTPSMSTLVVTSHVKEGLTMAHRHKLPKIVKDAIQQHHGTTLVSYFYHRACKQQENESAQENQTKAASKVNQEDFRYSGPRPFSREMAILALADPIEAASRSIEKPTSSRIESMVNMIIDKKLEDGQLDECDLTLKQLATIKRSFIFTLTNMLHGRIAYPQQNETTHKQSTDKTQD